MPASEKQLNLPLHMQTLIEQHQNSLIRFAVGILKRPEVAREVVQDTFLKYISTQSTPDTAGAIKSWLFTVCRNRCFDIIRKEKRMVIMGEQQFEMQSREPAPPRLMQENEQLNLVLNALDDLPTNQQEAIRLKFQNGFSYKQIAKITGHSVSNVGFLIHSGMSKLKARFASTEACN